MPTPETSEIHSSGDTTTLPHETTKEVIVNSLISGTLAVSENYSGISDTSRTFSVTPGSSIPLNTPERLSVVRTPHPHNSVATGEKLAKPISPSTGGKGVPSPFKRTLFWPGTPKLNNRKVE